MEHSKNWIAVVEELAVECAERVARHDVEGSFVAENYARLKELKIPSSLIPADLGGGGATLAEGSEMLRVLGRACPSTALALSMHTHLVAAAVYKYRNGMGGEPLLRKVAEGELILVSTGATDWIDSNGSARSVEGGYRVSGRKVFGSGSAVADMLITSIAWDEDPAGPSVLHFPVPFSAEGVRVLDDWNTLGMRGTGSHTVVFEDVFVPEEAVALRREKGKWHRAWDVALGVAPALYMAPYVGLAEAASELALERARRRPESSSLTLAVGEMNNALTTARVLWADMVRLTDGYAFALEPSNSSAQLTRKTLVTNAVKECVALSMEVAGGASFYRAFPFERLFRDVQASHYHPLPEKRQLEFSGRVGLGLSPVAETPSVERRDSGVAPRQAVAVAQ